MTRTGNHKEAENAVLMRMAKSRAALLAVNRVPPAVPVAGRRTRSPATDVLASLADAPRVTLLLALCVGTIVLGPRRAFVIVGRSGITAWLGGTVRKVIQTKPGTLATTIE
ncbi:UNVERIFIED_ORG: hypothetical protein J2Y81_007171 [Paraburkholderia sediminicola]|nr:hypothetical protein [Paraburkholderia sediminicola]